MTVTERGGRQYASTGSSWEPIIGYSRAVRAGALITVSGTVGAEPDGTFSASARAQTHRSLATIIAAIEALGGKVSDVVRTRIFVSDIAQWREIGEAHGEIFGQVRPATSMVEVAKLIDDAALVEIEADAVVAS